MAAMLKHVYQAFREAGVSDDKASAAAEEMAGYESRFNQVDLRFEKVESTLRVHTAILSINTVLLIAILVEAFFGG